MAGNKLIWLITLGVMTAFFAVLSGCQTSGSSSSGGSSTIVVDDAGDSGKTVSFHVDSNAILLQVIASNSKSASAPSESARQLSYQESRLQTYSGTLTIMQGSTTIGDYPVTASIDETTWEVKLQQSFVIAPGNYVFYLLLDHANTQYSGQASYTVDADQANTVSMTVAPIIGDSIVEVETISQLGSYRFYYADIPDLEFFEPKLGVVVDGGDEHLFQIKGTGMTEAYLNLTTGNHTVELKLYDGNQQKGKSLSIQESQYITAGQAISMDLVPVYGTTGYAIAVDGSSADFEIKIPTELVEQAGGTENLKISYIMNGPATDYTAIEGEISSIVYDAGQDIYNGEINLSGSFYAATLNFYISFIKEAEAELIGTCTIQTALNSDQRTSLCSIPVVNSLIASGNILGTAGITVCENNGSGGCGLSASGVNVYTLDSENGDEFIGITGSGNVASQGFLKANLKAGDYTVRAINSDGRFGEASFSLSALEVKNVQVILKASAPINPSIVINGGDQYTYSQYVSLTLSAEDQLGILAYYVSENNTAPGDDDWIAANQSQNFETTISYQLSDNTGFKTVYAWFKNVSGHRSESVQSSITVQDNTSLYYDNFKYTASENGSPVDGNGNSYCQNLGDTYRIADWNEVATVVSQNASVTTDDFKSGNRLRASSGFAIGNFWIGNGPTGAFVTYNGNASHGGEYYAISEPSNESRDTYYGWTPDSEPKISDATGEIQLYNVSSSQSAYVLCYRDDGLHPLLNGDFSQDRDHWDNTMGNTEVINEAMVLKTTEESVPYSSVQQQKIAVIPGQAYRITFKGKTSLETLNLTAGITGGDINAASFDEEPVGWMVDQNADLVKMAGESSNTDDGYYYSIQLDISAGSTDSELTIYFRFENNGSIGQSATIDDVTLSEVP